ncbi:TauD/TfdA family dioxygenase [Nitrospirillum iridis]|uniref:TauD/TfdA-like domain-containing protein n=1 Tax=Nitrospirillum iridis TaxID=765888 RepID=A0A7X0B2M7_9PROT|nr:TauD/TfdA family dioxygenase [Nitrospirillum iridis]MBB6254542.1 hypothetical protein [Nitrospirillum iridis]
MSDAMRMQRLADAPAFRLVEPGPGFRIPVRNRAFLAGSSDEAVPEAIPDAGGMIPIFAADRVDTVLSSLALSARATIDAMLPACGGVVLSALALADKADFERFMIALGYDFTGYVGGIAVRGDGAGVVLVASEEDARITLSPHNEMAYLATYPNKIFFFCQTEAPLGGEVPVNDIRQSIRFIPDSVKDDFRKKGIRYYRNLPKASSISERGWVDTFLTDDKVSIERIMRSLNYDFDWIKDDRLIYSYARPAFIAHPETGAEIWFNQVTELHSSYWRSHPNFPDGLTDLDYPATTTYGDGSPIDDDLISLLRSTLWTAARAVKMKKGDVLVLDNQVLQHGRFSFEGERRHFVSLTR